MKQWELARYLIDAKKCVDSVLYIADNAEKLRYFGLKELVDEKRNTFYINCCAVIDHTIATKTKDKKDLCAQDSIAELLYRERDKNSAHKDEDYIPQEFDKLIQIAEQMKAQLIHIADRCKEYIPSHLTLDFVPHDKALFRAIHKILAEDEEKIRKTKHPLMAADKSPFVQEGITKAILHDTLDLRTIPEEKRSEFAVVIEDGICFFEGIQERQDACIKINMLFNQNMWCSLDAKHIEMIQKLTELGVLDDFSQIQDVTDPIILARAKIIMDEAEK